MKKPLIERQKSTIMLNQEDFTEYMKYFLEENAKINLISKNEENFLWEKHIYDSLAIEFFFKKYINNLKGKNLIDIGTGGGFPALPIAIVYPDLKVTALDSIEKKLRAIERISSNLKIKNLKTVCTRAENHKKKYDISTSRAVGKLSLIVKYAMPLLKKGGYFVAYKSKLAKEEIEDAHEIIKKYSGEIKEIISYELPTEEHFERNLIIIQKTT